MFDTSLFTPSRKPRGCRHRVLLLAALAALAWSTPAGQAGTVTATFQGVSPSLNFTYNYNGGPNTTISAGVYNFTNASGMLTGDFATFCIQLTEVVAGGQTITYNVVALEDAPDPSPGPMGTAKADQVRELWGRHIADTTTPTGAAAFQVALWEIVHEAAGNPLNLSAGTFRGVSVSGGDITQAQRWLDELDGTGPKAAGLMGLTNDLAQDVLTVVVPEPGSLALGLSGLLSLGVLGRRRLRRFPGRGGPLPLRHCRH